MPCNSIHPALLFKESGRMDRYVAKQTFKKKTVGSVKMKKALQIMIMHITENMEQQIKKINPAFIFKKFQASYIICYNCWIFP